MKEEGEKICPWSYYMENLFGKDDLYLYRAISHFYAQNYQDAITDFKMCMKVKKLYKVLDNEAKNESNPVSEIGDQSSSDDSAYSS